MVSLLSTRARETYPVLLHDQLFSVLLNYFDTFSRIRRVIFPSSHPIGRGRRDIRQPVSVRSHQKLRFLPGLRSHPKRIVVH